MNPDFKKFRNDLNLILETYPKLTQLELAKKIGVHPTLITKWKNGTAKPSLDKYDKFYGVIISDFSDSKIAHRILGSNKRFNCLEDFLLDHKFLRADSPSTRTSPTIDITVNRPKKETIQAHVPRPPYVEPKSKELRIALRLNTQEFDGALTKLRFQDVDSEFYTFVEKGIIKVQEPLQIELHNPLRIPLELLEVEIDPVPNMLEDFFNTRHLTSEDAAIDLSLLDISQTSPQQIAHYITKSTFNPLTHGKALSEIATELYHQVRTRKWKDGAMTVSIRIALIDEYSEPSSHLITLTITKSEEVYTPPSFLENVWPVAKNFLEFIGIYGFESFFYDFKFDSEQLRESQHNWSGVSADLAIFLLIVFAHMGIEIPEDTAAIGSLEGAIIKTSSKLERKLSVLSDCKYIVLAESDYDIAQQLHSHTPAEKTPEIVPLNRWEDIFRMPLLKDKLFFTTEKNNSPTYQQISESGFDYENFPTICNFFSYAYIFKRNIQQGYNVEQLIFEYTDANRGWVPELEKDKETIIEAIRRENPKRNLYDGPLVNLDNYKIDGHFDGKQEIQFIRHSCSLTSSYPYMVQRATLDKMIVCDDEGRAVTIRKKYANHGRNIEISRLKKPMSGGCHLILTKDNEPYYVVLGKRDAKQAGYPNTWVSAAACSFPPYDTPKRMLEEPKDYGYQDEKQVREMLAPYKLLEHESQPHIGLTILREMPKESGYGLSNIRIELKDIIIRGFIYNIVDYAFTILGEVRLDLDTRASVFKDESDENDFIKRVSFNLESLAPMIANDSWTPTSLVGLLMSLSAHFGEEKVRDAIHQCRIRKIWL